MANRIQLRRGGAQEWANANPTLAQGELGIELDTGRFKIGDGVSAWNTLRYERPVESTSNTANTLVQRDADGNFAAGTITATIIGNASTAARLASTRQIQISGDLTATGNFDGSTNLNLASSLGLISTLPHYDGTASSSGTYTKLTVDAKGRITNASTPSTLADYNLNGTVEGSSAQPYDLDLVAISGLTTTGIISRTSGGAMATRTITGTAARIALTNGNGVSGNPTIDLITTAVTLGEYNAASLTSAAGSETVNATNYTVDDYGRLTASATLPIATATEGTVAAAYNNASTYSRGDKITNASKLYQAIAGIAAGAGAPTHSDTSDAGSWRYLAASATPQKGLASFSQEDFDVSAAGHVTFATAGIDNTQLQNSRVSFADGNTKEDFALDQELTATTGYRGFNYLNYVKVNDTSGNLLFGANNTGDSGAGEVDINARLYFSDADITFDGTTAQTLDKTGDGNLTFQTTQNSTSTRSLSIFATNLGSGDSKVIIGAEDAVTITASDAAGKVQVEDMYFQGDYIASSAATMILDPGDDRDVSGKVQIMGDLQVDGTTTTINSAVTTLDDPIITLGGDTAPASDDNKDRGIEFRYYDSQARVGFFGYDDSANDLGGHAGSFTFLYNATNSSEVFSGTDAGIIAGNLKLTTGTASTTNTSGDLVVAGGAGIGGSVNIGGSVDIDTNLGVTGTSLFTDEVVIKGASKSFILKDGSNNAKITAVTTSGNLTMAGILAVTGNVDVNTDKFNITAASGNTAIAGVTTISNDAIVKADNKMFKVQTAAGVDKFTVDTDNGDIDGAGKLNVADLVHFESTDEPNIALNNSTDLYEIQSSDYGALRVDGGGFFDKAVLFDSDIYLNGDFNQRDSGTESWGLRNWLQVRYKIRAGSSVSYNPSYSNHNTSNLRVYGGAGVNQNLHVGATGSGEGLFVGKKNSGDTVKFTVLGATGNITSEGTLTQNGNAEFNGTVDVDGNFAVRSGTTDKFTIASATGNAVNEGELNVKGAVDFDSTLNVDGTATIQDDLIVKSDNKMFKVQTAAAADKFTVDTDNGNTVISGTLQVDGQINVNDSVVIDEANEIFSIRNGSAVEKFGVDTDNGNTNIIGTLTVGDATQINDTFGVSGVVTSTNNTEQTLSGSYAADGSVRLSGGLGMAKNLAVGGGARVYGNTELTGTLDLNNDADISGNLVVSNTDEATSLADASVALQVAGGATIDKNTYVGGNFVVYDAGNTRPAFTVTNATGDAELHNTLTVGGNLVVNGTTTTVNSTTVTLDDPIITLGGDTAPASNDAKDRGVEFRYYDGSAKIGFFGFDRSSQEFTFLTGATNTSEVFAGTDGALRIGSLNVTGAGTSVDIDNNLNVDGTATVDGQIISQLAQGTAPFVVASTTKVNNLNADLLDGLNTSATDTTGNSVVVRSSGSFSADQITVSSSAGAAAGILGNASSADVWKTARTLTIDGVVDGTVSINGGSDPTLSVTFNDADITALAAQSGTGYMVRTAANTYAHRTFAVTASSGITLTNADGTSGNTTINVASSAANAANNLVLRDSSGDFASNQVSAKLVAGNVQVGVTGTNEIDTSSGNLTLDSTGGTVDIDDILTVQGTTTFNDDVTFVGSSGNAVWDKTDNALELADNVELKFGAGSDLFIDSDGTDAYYKSTGTSKQIIQTAQLEVKSQDGSAYGLIVDADGSVTLGHNGTATFVTTATGAELTGDLLPEANNTRSIGSTTKKYTNVHSTTFTGDLVGGVTGNVVGNVTGNLVATTSTAKNLNPASDSNFDLGTNTVRWQNIYADAANITAITGTLTGTASSIANHDTDALTEGSTNLYFTNERVDDRVDALIVAGTGLTKTYDDAAGTYTLAFAFSEFDSDSVVEGSTNLFTTAARTRGHFTYGTGITHDGSGGLSVTQADINTDNVTEGSTNLFTTAARTRTHFTYGTGITHSSGTLSVTQADIDTDNVTEGSTNLFTTAARTRGHFTYGTGIEHNGSGTISVTQSEINTDNVTEGSTNLFTTAARTRTHFTYGTGITHSGGTLSVTQADINTDNITEGSTNIFFTNTRADTRINLQTGANLDLSQKSTTNLPEGTNLYHTEARVQTKLDNAFEQLRAMLNNLATTTTLKLNLSGDPTPGAVVTLGSISNGGVGGYTSATNVATTGGTGSSLTVDTTADADGVITGIALNAAGTGYLIGDTLTITNPNLGGVDTLNLGTLSGGVGGFTGATGVATTSSASGTNLTVNTTVNADGAITNVAINNAGSGYVAGETITIANANAGGVDTVDTLVGGTGYANGTAIATTGGGGSSLTLDITTSNGVVTGATINAAGTGYAVDDTITIVNANATGVRTLGSIATAGTGYAGGSAIATTSSGSGTNLTVDIAVDSDGAITTATINDDGSGYADAETITITNANASGVKTLGSISAGGTGYSAGSAIATTSSGSGTGLTVDITVSSGVVNGVTINGDGLNYAASEVITITNANASGIATLGSLATAGTGYSTGTAIATTSSGSGTTATIDIDSVSGTGAITGVTLNGDGSGYAASEVLTITNANASGAKTLGNFGATDSSRTPGTYTAISSYVSQASGQNATFTVVIGVGGTVDSITIVNDGDSWIVNETVTIGDSQLGGGGAADLTFDVTAIHGNGATIPVSAIHGNGATIPVSAIHGNGCTIPVSAIHGNGATVDVAAIWANATVDVSTVFENAQFALADITAMEVGATLTGSTSGTTGVITAMDSTSVTVDTVDGFYKKGETVGANDVTNLTISSFG